MISIRDTAQSCFGVTGRISVTRDIFGYVFRDGSNRIFGALAAGDVLPISGSQTRRSLLSQLRLAKGQAIHLSIFLVDHENDFSGSVTMAQVMRVQFAIQVAREIYAQANLGIRKIFWRRIGTAESGNYATITDRPEAVDLTDDFSGPNDGLDVFFVQNILNAGGWCNTGGPCDKNAKDEMTGVVIELSNSSLFTGILLAHEAGHYLGLGTGPNANNMMGVDSNNDGIDELSGTSTNITNGQASTMRSHCLVKSAC